MRPRSLSPPTEASFTSDARNALARLDLAGDTTPNTNSNFAPEEANDGTTSTLEAHIDTSRDVVPKTKPLPALEVSQDQPTPTSKALMNSAQNHSSKDEHSRAWESTSSVSVAQSNPKISLREYTRWKASGISPYSVYLVWKEEEGEMEEGR